MKTFVLTVSRVFPATHRRKGERTYFPEKILVNEDINIASDKFTEFDIVGFEPKIHTIRANYELWNKRAKEINEGKAILSIRYWSDKPYRSKQVEICILEKIGIQKIVIDPVYLFRIDDSEVYFGLDDIAKNDGLSIEDFKNWFKNYDKIEPMAIIHFTEFRY